MDAERFVVVVGSGAAGTACRSTPGRSGRAYGGRRGGQARRHVPLARLHAQEGALQRRRGIPRARRRRTQFGVTCAWSRARLGGRARLEVARAGELRRRPGTPCSPNAGIEVVRGTARFDGPLKLRVGDTPSRADRRSCSPAARPPRLPQIPGAALADTSNEALHYPAPAEVARDRRGRLHRVRVRLDLRGVRHARHDARARRHRRCAAATPRSSRSPVAASRDSA